MYRTQIVISALIFSLFIAALAVTVEAAQQPQIILSTVNATAGQDSIVSVSMNNNQNAPIIGGRFTINHGGYLTYISSVEHHMGYQNAQADRVIISFAAFDVLEPNSSIIDITFRLNPSATGAISLTLTDASFYCELGNVIEVQIVNSTINAGGTAQTPVINLTPRTQTFTGIMWTRNCSNERNFTAEVTGPHNFEIINESSSPFRVALKDIRDQQLQAHSSNREGFTFELVAGQEYRLVTTMQVAPPGSGTLYTIHVHPPHEHPVVNNRMNGRLQRISEVHIYSWRAPHMGYFSFKINTYSPNANIRKQITCRRNQQISRVFSAHNSGNTLQLNAGQEVLILISQQHGLTDYSIEIIPEVSMQLIPGQTQRGSLDVNGQRVRFHITPASSGVFKLDVAGNFRPGSFQVRVYDPTRRIGRLFSNNASASLTVQLEAGVFYEALVIQNKKYMDFEITLAQIR